MASRSKLFYHFVWSTKYRRHTITEEIRAPLYAAIVKKVTDFGAYVHALDGTEDHVHLVVEVPPVHAPAAFIGAVKGYSAHSVNEIPRDEADTRNGYPFGWQNEYTVESVSESALPAVIRYVERQREHHAIGSVHPAVDSIPVGRITSRTPRDGDTPKPPTAI